MNLYDTKSIHCNQCGKFIGEIEFDAVITLPKCGNYSNPKPESDDTLSYLSNRLKNSAEPVAPHIIKGF